MSAFYTFIKSRGLFSVVLSVVLTILFVFATVQAATTISTDVTTGGNIYATSTLVVDGSVTLGGTVDAPTVGIASSTPWGLLSVEATSTVGANAPMFVVSDQGTSTPAFYIDGNDGSIGIGSTTPSATPLSVVGDVYVSSGLGVGMVVTADGRISASNDIAVASTSPWGQFSVEAFNLSGNAPIFVVGSQGTSTPLFVIDGNTGLVGIASSTPSEPFSVGGDVSIGSAATTTIFIDSTDSATPSGGCLQMRGADGTLYRAYIMSTTTGDVAEWRIDAGTCQ